MSLIPSPSSTGSCATIAELASPDDFTEMAVQALDALVYDINAAASGLLPKRFWDWIADDITPFVAASAQRLSNRFDLSTVFHLDALKAEISSWVRSWVMPYVTAQYLVGVPEPLPSPSLVLTVFPEFEPEAFPDVLIY